MSDPDIKECSFEWCVLNANISIYSVFEDISTLFLKLMINDKIVHS